MSVTSAKSGATGISLALDNNYMEPIATVRVGAGGSSIITFSDIPQNYKHLQLRAFAQASYPSGFGGSGGGGTRFNGDASTNYTRHYIAGTYLSVGAGAVTGGTAANLERFPYIQSGTSSVFGVAIMDILDYTNTNKYKTIRNLGGLDLNSNATTDAQVHFNSNLWMSTDAITRIDINPGAAYVYNQYSRFSLYGIKG